MTENTPVVLQDWVSAAPEECTLPTVQRPLRATEWQNLFATEARAVHRVDARRARAELRPDPGVAARAADLMMRETQCCTFFSFALTATGGHLTLDVATPPGQVAVLEALVDGARAAVGSR
jgi:hypothetical protein